MMTWPELLAVSGAAMRTCVAALQAEGRLEKLPADVAPQLPVQRSEGACARRRRPVLREADHGCQGRRSTAKGTTGGLPGDSAGPPQGQPCSAD